MPGSDTITIRLVEHGENEIEVNRAEYEKAKADGDLDQFLDTHASNIDSSYVVIEPDGTEIDPFAA